MYAVAINLPRLLAMLTNLMELSNCCISFTEDIQIFFSAGHTVILQPLFYTDDFLSIIKCHNVLLSAFQNLDIVYMSNLALKMVFYFFSPASIRVISYMLIQSFFSRSFAIAARNLSLIVLAYGRGTRTSDEF
jgi:hypothetical protein